MQSLGLGEKRKLSCLQSGFAFESSVHCIDAQSTAVCNEGASTMQ